MTITCAASALAMRPRALTTVVLEMVDEEGHHGLYGRVYLSHVHHPYCFVSREAAARFARWRLAQGLCDGFELETPGHVPPEPPPLIRLEELPF